MNVITLQEPQLVAQVTEIAKVKGQSANEFILEAVRHHVAMYRKKRIQAETVAWYALPLAQRQAYQGQYVAVYLSNIVDSDKERLTLFHRTRQRFGNEPVLIIEGGGDDMPTYRITSARRE